jgi:hypothetical protein
VRRTFARAERSRRGGRRRKRMRSLLRNQAAPKG